MFSKKQDAIQCADLHVYMSNSIKAPNEANHDMFVFHNNIKVKSKVTSFQYINNDKPKGKEHARGLNRDDELNELGEIKETNTVYMSI